VRFSKIWSVSHAVQGSHGIHNLFGGSKELGRIRKPVDTKYEIAAYIRKTSDIKGPALLFENVSQSKFPVLGGVFATRKRALLALETSEKECAEKFHRALEHLISPRRISSGPCKDVILKSEDADLSRFPIPIFSQNDSGPFITAGLVISRDQESARNNTIYRLQIHGSCRLGRRSLSPIEVLMVQSS
jgi:2,5-furandicarboxylate decarboxylase 1